MKFSNRIERLENQVSAAIQEEQAGLTLIMDANAVGKAYPRGLTVVIGEPNEVA